MIFLFAIYLWLPVESMTVWEYVPQTNTFVKIGTVLVPKVPCDAKSPPKG